MRYLDAGVFSGDGRSSPRPVDSKSIDANVHVLSSFSNSFTPHPQNKPIPNLVSPRKLTAFRVSVVNSYSLCALQLFRHKWGNSELTVVHKSTMY